MDWKEIIRDNTKTNAVSAELRSSLDIDMSKMEFEEKVIACVLYIKMTKLIEELGWNEHTSD